MKNLIQIVIDIKHPLIQIIMKRKKMQYEAQAS